MKRILFVALTALNLLILMSSSAPAIASTSDTIQSGVCAANGGTCPSNPTTTLNGTVATVINVFSAVAGVAAVIMIIVGGFRYVTSAGNSESAKSARNTILYAIIGIVIVALAQILVHFVIHTAS